MSNQKDGDISTTKATTALIASTLAFTLCFAVWVQNAVLVTTLVRQGTIQFDEAQIGWLLAAPILTGSITRVPLGVLTDRFGGRIVMAAVMIGSALPLYGLSLADSFTGFLAASLGFGISGGSFAVGVAYVSLWFNKQRQGVALGIFGLGNAGAALTTAFAPGLLAWATSNGTNPQGWRTVPQLGAGALVIGAIAFFLIAGSRRIEGAQKSMSERLAPLRDATVWRFGLYYFLVFGAFVTLAQWLIPYCVSAYNLSVADAGRIATYFSLPASLVSIAGGIMADRFGARALITWIFRGCIVVCILLSVPPMTVNSPGEGVLAKFPGEVTSITGDSITVGKKAYPIQKASEGNEPEATFLPRVRTYQEPIVEVGAKVVKNQLLARGTTRLQYPANLWTFTALVVLLGTLFGIGKASVLKFIPEQFPQAVGGVSGLVGMVGALSGFFFPILFGYLLRWSGIWSTCWIVLLLLSIVCLVSVQIMVARILREEAPDLARLIERRPTVALTRPLDGMNLDNIEVALKSVSFFANLSDGERKRLVSVGKLRSLKNSELLFEEGSSDTALYVVLRGSVELHRLGPEGQKVHLRDVAEGEYFGEMGLLDGAPRAASANATNDAELFVLERKELLALLSKSPHMVTDLLVGLSGLIRIAVDRIASQSSTASANSLDATSSSESTAS